PPPPRPPPSFPTRRSSDLTTCTGIVPSSRRDPPRTATTVIVYVPRASGRWWNLPEKGTRLRPRLPRTVVVPATAQLGRGPRTTRDRKSTRLNSSHVSISYA